MSPSPSPFESAKLRMYTSWPPPGRPRGGLGPRPGPGIPGTVRPRRRARRRRPPPATPGPPRSAAPPPAGSAPPPPRRGPRLGVAGQVLAGRRIEHVHLGAVEPELGLPPRPDAAGRVDGHDGLGAQ